MAKTSFYSGTGVSTGNISDLQDILEDTAASQDAAATSAAESAASAVLSANSANAAQDAQGFAEDAQAAAEAAQAAAETAQTGAETAETNAETSQAAAEAAQVASEAARDDSSTYATNSANSASASASSASAAAASASAANQSAIDAAADAVATAADLVATNADVVSAAASEAAAASSASNSATSAAQSASSASASSASASASASSASAALASEQAAAASESASASSASAAATSASNAASSAANAAADATDVFAALDEFTDLYLGAKSSAPTTDNDGDPLQTGALYWNTSLSIMYLWDGSQWVQAYSAASGVLLASNNLSDISDAATARTNLGLAIGTNVQAYDANTVVDGSYVHTDNNYTTTEKNKLAGIEAGATADQTAAEILTAIKTVDGAGSGLDADLLDGNQASAFSLTSHNHTLDSLSNTTITTNTSGEILKWNGTAWVNNTLAEAGIQPAGSYLTTSTTFGGDVSGTYNAIVVANDSHTHAFDNLTGKTGGTGNYTTTGTMTAATFNATSTTNGGFQGIDADSATNPSFTWSADLNTGIYRPAADQIGFTTGGTVACTISGSNFNVVGALNAPTVDTNSVVIGAGVTLTEATDRADLLKITSSTAGWGGIQISNTSNEFLWSFMGDGTVGGIYDDLSNAWAIQFDDGGEVRLYYAGAEKLNTHSTGVTITGHLRPTFINWDNTGTAVIVASNNVSSGTDRSVGVWTTNFSVTWPAVNYGMAGGVNANAGTGNAAISFNTANSGNQYTTTAMGQASEDVDAGYTDYNNNTVIYYG